MKTSINAWAFPAEMTFEDIFKAAKEYGYEALELNVDAVGANKHSFNYETTDAQLEEIKTLKATYGIDVQSVSTGLYWSCGTFADSDPNKKAEAIKVLKTQLRCARGIGADTILVVTSPDKAAGLEKSFENTVNTFKALKKEIAEYGVKVGIENVGNNFFTSPMDFKLLIEAIGDENVGMYFDVGNMMDYSYPEWWIDIIGDHVLKIHIKDYKRNGGCHTGGTFCKLLEGDIDWATLSPLIAKYYDGPITAEVLPGETPFGEFLENTKNALDKIINISKNN